MRISWGTASLFSLKDVHSITLWMNIGKIIAIFVACI